MKQKAKYLLKSGHGFTRLQNVMIFVIIAIVVAVGAYAFYGYIRSSYQVKAANTARRVYEGAGDYLKEQKLGDDLEEFNRLSSHFGGLLTMDLQQQILASLYEGDDFEAFFQAYEEKYQDIPIRYITMESEALKNEEREENPILKMLDYYVLDDNIRKHTFLIEYNGNTGEVMGVLYSEKTDTFTFEGSTKNKGNAILRDEKSLDRKWQGYYGMSLEDL